MTDPNQPTERDLILGGQAPPPMNGMVLGGIVGLQQQFALAPADRKIKLLLQAINYDEDGINLLISGLADPDINVRVAAYELLWEIDTNAAERAIAGGISLYPGDLIYRVYESQISYDDSYHYIVDSLADWEDWWGCDPLLLGSYLSRAEAEAVAWKFHKQKMQQVELSCIYKDNYNYEEFNIESWWIENFPLYRRQPLETNLASVERLRKILLEEMGNESLATQLWQDFQQKDFNLDRWIDINLSRLFPSVSADDESCIYRQVRFVLVLKALGYEDLLGQLWVEIAGKLAFVEEEIVTESGYFNSFDLL
jgi:hypothetical protein